MKIGFIGLGLMGVPMVGRLLDAGYEVVIWNRSKEKCQDPVLARAKNAQSPGRLAQLVDCVMLCVANTEAVRDVTFGSNGVVSGASDEKVLIDLSSSEPKATKEMAAELLERTGMPWVDAPVSGGVPGAEAGTLAIMMGGDALVIGRIKPVLENLGQRLTHMGPVGAGQVTKVCNQMIVSCNAMVLAEMIALAERSGVDASLIPEALQGGFADSKPLQILGPQMAERSFEPIKWHVKTLLKDLNMAAQLSLQSASPVPMSGLAGQLMQIHAEQGYADKDPATLIELYQKKLEENATEDN